MKQLLTTLAILALPLIGNADTTQTTRSIFGYGDKQARNPHLTVSRSIGTSNVQILADADIIAPEYRIYPIIFQFFVNGSLIATQYRSPQLPRAIGVDVGSDIANLPFNYTVVASVLHPNRTFNSVIEGSAFENELSATLNCDVSYNDASYSNPTVAATQNSSDTYTIDFKATRNTDDSIFVTSVINSSSATTVFSIDDNGTVETFTASGFSNVNGELSSLSFTNNSNFTISCN